MSNWDPKDHPRDMRTGQFTEDWISAVSAQMPGGGATREFSPADREQIQYLQNLARSRSLRHDMTTWSPDRARGVRDTADNLLAMYANGFGTLTDDEDEDLSYVRSVASDTWEEWQKVPPWEGGPPDWEGKHYEAWAAIVKELIANHGYDPDSEILLNAIPWDDDVDVTGEAYYQGMMRDNPVDLIRIEIESFVDDYSEEDVRSAYNAIGVHSHSMDSYDHPGAKEVSLHDLAAHPDFSSSGKFEIYVPEMNDWALMEDQNWNEADEELTLWAGDYHYIIGIDDDHPIIRRIDG